MRNLQNIPYFRFRFFLEEGLVCDNALPATDLLLALLLPSLKIEDAFVATALDVCFLFDLSIYIISFNV